MGWTEKLEKFRWPFTYFIWVLAIFAFIFSCIALAKEPKISKDQRNDINQGIDKIIKTTAAASANASVSSESRQQRSIFFKKSSKETGNLTKKDITLASYDPTDTDQPEFIELGKIPLDSHKNPVFVFSYLQVTFEAIYEANSDDKELLPFWDSDPNRLGDPIVYQGKHKMDYSNVEFGYKIVTSDVAEPIQVMHGFDTITHRKKTGGVVKYDFHTKEKSVQVQGTFDSKSYAIFGVRIWHRLRDMTKGEIIVKGLKAHTDDTFAT